MSLVSDFTTNPFFSILVRVSMNPNAKQEFLWQPGPDYQGLIGDWSFNIAQIIPTAIEFMFCW